MGVGRYYRGHIFQTFEPLSNRISNTLTIWVKSTLCAVREKRQATLLTLRRQMVYYDLSLDYFSGNAIACGGSEEIWK